jgi:hypothetical protein
VNNLLRVILDWISWVDYKIAFFSNWVRIVDRVNDIVIEVHGPSQSIQTIACPYLQIFCVIAGKEFDQMAVVLLAKSGPKEDLGKNENCCWGGILCPFFQIKTFLMNCT